VIAFPAALAPPVRVADVYNQTSSNSKVYALAAARIGLTPREYAEFRRDLKRVGEHVTEKLFANQFLAAWGKNLFEWREDVVKPKLLMARLCQGRVRCTEEDVRKAFEAQFGVKLQYWH